MSFRKTKMKVFSCGSLPIEEYRVKSSTEIDSNGRKRLFTTVDKVDVSDPANYVSLPDPSVFNDLESQLASGIKPQFVNTVQMRDDSISDLNEIANNIPESTPNTEE